MPRPKNPRTIHAPPSVEGFRPRGTGQKQEIILSVEEFEAIRLVDFEGLDQTRAADLMRISRQTFGRVLRSGRFTLSKALVKGLHLKVEGGCYRIRGNGHAHGQGNGLGNQRRRQGAIDPLEPQQISSGGNVMVENNEKNGQGTRNTPSPGRGGGQGQGTGQGQGRGRGLGGGKGDGSCRKKDGGMGRGLGGGRRDGGRGGQ
ncbi:MAG: DUF134 domain-containing protein [Desulfobacterium sp.]